MARSPTDACRSNKWGPTLLLHSALLFVQMGTSGYQVITRIALTSGMNLFVFAVYRGAIGLCFLIPIAFFAERNTRPPLTWALLGHFFLLGLTGVFLSQALYLEGLSYTSPTFAAAIQNSIPAITFVIAVAFGQEKVEIKRLRGQAKLGGTLTCVAGATVMVLYSGPAIINLTATNSNNSTIITSVPSPPYYTSKLGSTSSSPLHRVRTIANHNISSTDPHNNVNNLSLISTTILPDALIPISSYTSMNRDHHKIINGASYISKMPILSNDLLGDMSYSINGASVKSWQIGALFLVGMCIAFSFWLVIQRPVMAQYPARLSITAIMTLFGTLQLLVLALFRVRDRAEWVTFTWGSYELFSVFYAGIVVSGLVFSVQMWCVQRGGAVLTAVYQPAQTLIVAILTLLFLHDSFYLGSLIGGSLIIVGVYLVIWGQGGRGAAPPDLTTSRDAVLVQVVQDPEKGSNDEEPAPLNYSSAAAHDSPLLLPLLSSDNHSSHDPNNI